MCNRKMAVELQVYVDPSCPEGADCKRLPFRAGLSSASRTIMPNSFIFRVNKTCPHDRRRIIKLNRMFVTQHSTLMISERFIIQFGRVRCFRVSMDLLDARRYLKSPLPPVFNIYHRPHNKQPKFGDS